MANVEDKGKSEMHDQSDLMGVKPFGSIGPDRSTEETKSVVGKLKKKKADSMRAEGSTSEDGEKANLGGNIGTLNRFANK
jgi:hypothetical protein